jgi:tRNA(Ile2) C34 agmatinyltransferase TiaS
MTPWPMMVGIRVVTPAKNRQAAKSTTGSTELSARWMSFVACAAASATFSWKAGIGLAATLDSGLLIAPNRAS